MKSKYGCYKIGYLGPMVERHSAADSVCCDAFPGWDITREQAEFGAAMVKYRATLGRELTAVEVLRVARFLGYRKVT